MDSVLAQSELAESTVVSYSDDKAFSEYVHRVREEVIQLHDKFPFWKVKRNYIAVPGGNELWYGEPPNEPYYLKITGGPGTLAFDILRRRVDLPRYNCNLEIMGNDIREVEPKPFVDPDDDDVDPDLEDCSEEVAKLPLIDVDPEKHFTKRPTYKQEIGYLLQCQGSKQIVQLLGRSSTGDLVFPKIQHALSYTMLWNNDTGRIRTIQRWMLEIIDGVAYLHSLGIVHRDLTTRNILDPLSSPLIICDLQCLHGTYWPFELEGGDYSKFSFASDVFALGGLLWECCFYNNPPDRHAMLEYPPPPPFRSIFLACTAVCPEDRPTLAQLKVMYEAVAPGN